VRHSINGNLVYELPVGRGRMFGANMNRVMDEAPGTYGSGAVGSLRVPGYQDYDASVSKDFAVYHEQRLQFRVDASNALNLTSLGNPGSQSAESASFGVINSVRSGPRMLQLDLKYIF
jgi:hypothetical protein